ncbi:unnamed protein product [Rhizophagus irregularis]|nr:unnamed protein product [Rhizophagus irregularis]
MSYNNYKVLDTNEQYTNLTSYVQYTAPTHLASYIAPDEQYADDILTHFTLYTSDRYAATLAYFTSNIDDTALTQHTSFVTPNADNTLIQYASPTCPILYPSEPSLPTSDDILQDDESDDDQPLELVSELTFASLDRFKKWLDRFALKEGFDHKIRTSEKEQGILRRVAYECGMHQINSFNNHHNHSLTPIIRVIAPHFRKLTPKMLEDIEKYVNQGRIDSGSIYPLLRHDYPDQPIHKKDLYNAIYQFRQKNNPGATDASQMLQQLLE